MNLPSSHNHLRPQNELADRKFLRIYFFAYIKIDPPWSMTLNKKRFLIYQESKLLIFANDFGLKLLPLSKNCLADGTFKTAPSPLYQIYTIFGSSKEWKFPVVWALLGQKSNKNYQNFFGTFFHAGKLITDYETGVIPAIRKRSLSRNILVVGFTILSAFCEKFRNLDYILFI